jgi:hypothetical protein
MALRREGGKSRHHWKAPLQGGCGVALQPPVLIPRPVCRAGTSPVSAALVLETRPERHKGDEAVDAAARTTPFVSETGRHR